MKGIVIESTGSWYKVDIDGTIHDCRTRGRLRLKGFRSTSPVVVGDRVEMGGLLGSAPVMPVYQQSSAEFIARGGRIPAPIQSLKN